MRPSNSLILAFALLFSCTPKPATVLPPSSSITIPAAPPIVIALPVTTEYEGNTYNVTWREDGYGYFDVVENGHLIEHRLNKDTHFVETYNAYKDSWR